MKKKMQLHILVVTEHTANGRLCHQKNYLFMCSGVLETGLHKKQGLSEMLVGWHHTVGGGAR